jgi:c-di-GMP-binding flagellar brake protein YcgR
MLNLDSEDSVQFQGRILNLSLVGCCIETERPTALRVNDQLEVYFQLNGFPLLLMGIAKSIHSPQKIGIEFLEVSPRKQDQLKYILNDLKEELAEKKKQSKAQS